MKARKTTSAPKVGSSAGLAYILKWRHTTEKGQEYMRRDAANKKEKRAATQIPLDEVECCACGRREKKFDADLEGGWLKSHGNHRYRRVCPTCRG